MTFARFCLEHATQTAEHLCDKSTHAAKRQPRRPLRPLKLPVGVRAQSSLHLAKAVSANHLSGPKHRGCVRVRAVSWIQGHMSKKKGMIQAGLLVCAPAAKCESAQSIAARNSVDKQIISAGSWSIRYGQRGCRNERINQMQVNTLKGHTLFLLICVLKYAPAHPKGTAKRETPQQPLNPPVYFKTQYVVCQGCAPQGHGKIISAYFFHNYFFNS